MGFEPTTASLEGWNSTTELRPPVVCPYSMSNRPTHRTQSSFQSHKPTWWAGKDLNLGSRWQQIYSLPPLTTWVPARNAMYEKSIYTMTVNRLHFFIVLMRKEEQTNPRTSPPPYQGRIYAGKCEPDLSSKLPILLIKCSEVKSQN